MVLNGSSIEDQDQIISILHFSPLNRITVNNPTHIVRSVLLHTETTLGQYINKKLQIKHMYEYKWQTGFSEIYERKHSINIQIFTW